MIHRINVFFLSLVIALSPIILINNANAASLGGWTLGGGVAQGASTVYNGTKNLILNGKNVVQKGVATITPTATGVAKVLARGAAGYALSVAVEQLLGAVDWVLDPANNRINYTTFEGSYQIGSHAPTDTPQKACTNLASSMISSTWPSIRSTNVWKEGNDFFCAISLNTSTGGEAQFNRTPIKTIKQETDEKYLPLPVVAKQVIQNAESETDQDKKAAAQEATTAAAADIVAEAEKDSTKARPIVTQLESSAETATDETATGEATKPDTVDPTAPPDVTNISLKFPVFCGWAPTVCQAASVVISFPTLVTEWWQTANTKADGWATSISQAWTDVKDWVKTEEPAQTDTKVDVEPSAVPPTDNNYLQWNAYCPFTAKSDDISINGETSALSSDLTSWCTMASEIKPFVLLAGALASLMIVSGVGLGRSED